MRKVCVEHLRPGMILGKDIHGYDESVVYHKGVQLDQESIEGLFDLGLGYVHIQSSGDKQADRRDLFRRCEEYVQDFYKYVNPESNLFNELFRQTLTRTFNAVQQEWKLPCAQELKAKEVEHLTDVFFTDETRPEDIVKYETELVSFPDIYFRIQEVLEDPNSTAEDIAKVVSTDLSLSAKLLRLINSPFYGFSSKIDSVARAVALLGSKEISNLALGISTVNFFENIPPELMDMETFWRHSLRCAVYARLIASRVQGVEVERFFTTGLLHDAGRLVLFKNMPYASVQILLFARSNMLPLVEAESSVLGYDHTDIGGLLLQEWRFPSSLVNMIQYHHSPGSSDSYKDPAIIQLADNLALASDIPSGGKFVLPGMEEDLWDILELSGSDLQEMFELHDQHIDELLNIYI